MFNKKLIEELETRITNLQKAAMNNREQMISERTKLIQEIASLKKDLCGPLYKEVKKKPFEITIGEVRIVVDGNVSYKLIYTVKARCVDPYIMKIIGEREASFNSSSEAETYITKCKKYSYSCR